MIKIFGKAIAGLVVVFAFVCCSSVQPAYQNTVSAEPYLTQQDGPVTMQTFYDELEPYGQWINDPELGYVWSPNVQEGFKPYATNGHWAETEYGNTWVSDYDWGWAAFHYGRWRLDNYYGWEWVPGTEWGPAWVNWRTGGDYYGWAPLGPGIDIDIAFGNRYYAPDNYWVFVPRQYLCSPSINRYYLPANRNVTIIRNTTIINNVYNGGNRRYISGPPRAEIQRYTGNRVNVYNINNNNLPGATRISNNSINIYRPQFTANGNGNNRPAPNRVVNRGGVDDNRNRTNNNFGRNNGNTNNNGGFGNSRQLGNQGNGVSQNHNPANPNSGGNNNNSGLSRPARTDNPNNQFPQRGTLNPNVNNNTGINNPGSAPATTNGNNPSNTNGRQARENATFPNTNSQPANDWLESRNFDRNRNRTATDNQQIQQNQAQRQQEVQQRQIQQQQNQVQQQQMQQQREQQNQQRQQQMQQTQVQQQQMQQQREQQNQQRQQQMQQQREQQNQQREQQRQQQIAPPQQQERPARQVVPERTRPERIQR